MRNLIQLRGSNGVGKSTAVKQFLSYQSPYPDFIETKLGTVPIERTETIAVLGDYSKTTPGADRISSKELLAEALDKLMQRGFDTIIFEGLVFGTTFRLSSILSKLAKRRGYTYTTIMLNCDFETAYNRVFSRSGDSGQNVDTWQGRQNQCFKTSKKLELEGINVRFVNTATIPFEDMHRIIEDVIADV